MKTSLLRRAAAMLTVLAIAFVMTACYQPPGAVITDPNSPSQNTTEAPTPTFPAKDGQLTLSLLLGIMKSDMQWSRISPYTHTLNDDTHATFAVADNYGKECTLSVTFDAAADKVTEATLSYKDVSVDVLTDNTLVIRTIMVAMNEG